MCSKYLQIEMLFKQTARFSLVKFKRNYSVEKMKQKCYLSYIAHIGIYVYL